jgi:hypothetical protein
LVEFGKQLSCGVLLTGVPAEWRQGIRCERHEVVERQAAGDVLDVRVQAAVLVHDQHTGQLACRAGGPREVPPHARVPLGRRVGEVLGLQALVVLGNLLRLGEPGVQRIEQHRGRHSTGGVLRRLVQEAAAINRTVHVGVEQDQHLGVEIVRGLAFHVILHQYRQLRSAPAGAVINIRSIIFGK